MVQPDGTIELDFNAIDNAQFIGDSDGDGKDELVVLYNQVAEVWDADGLKYEVADPYLEWTDIHEANGAVFLLGNPDPANNFTFRQELQEDGTLVGVPAVGGQQPANDSYDFNGDDIADMVSFTASTVTITLGAGPVEPETPTEPEEPETPTEPEEPETPTEEPESRRLQPNRKHPRSQKSLRLQPNRKRLRSASRRSTMQLSCETEMAMVTLS